MSKTLPVKYRARPDKKIVGMPYNEWRWTVPWAMDIDDRGHGYLNPSYPAESRDGPAGTMCMRVMRTQRGYVVDLSAVRDGYEWEPRNGAAGLPVVEFQS